MRTSLFAVFASFLAACGGRSEASPSETAPPMSSGGEVRAPIEGPPADAPVTDAQPATTDAHPANELETGWPDPDICLPQLLSDARERGGICLEPEVIGDACVEACRARLQADGWVRDDAVEQRVLSGAGVRIVCVRAP